MARTSFYFFICTHLAVSILLSPVHPSSVSDFIRFSQYSMYLYSDEIHMIVGDIYVTTMIVGLGVELSISSTNDTDIINSDRGILSTLSDCGFLLFLSFLVLGLSQ